MPREPEVPAAFVDRRGAVIEVFKILAVRWPKVFAASKSAEMLPVWLAALTPVETAALVPAATDFAATNTGQYAPNPAQFAAHARAWHRRVTGETRGTPDVAESLDPLDGARPMWFAKPGPERGPYRLDADHAIAFAIDRGPLAGGTLGLSDIELDRIYRHETPYGWMAPDAVPEWAVPVGWHARWRASAASSPAATGTAYV